jgi:hypothetical protein
VSILLDILTVQYQLCYPGPNCQILSQALNLPVLPNNATTTQCCQQVMDYLGCGITAWCIPTLNLPPILFCMLIQYNRRQKCAS